MRKVVCFIVFAALMMRPDVAQAQVFYDASAFPVYGKASDAMAARYKRLPDALDSVARKPVVNLGTNSAGLYVRFRSNSTSIHVKWESTGGNRMNHMADTGVRGLDLYILTDEGWRFAAVARPSAEKQTQSELIKRMPVEDREYMLYLSLYDGVSKLEIGVDAGARLEQPQVDSPRAGKQIVMYGTSILQGGCCSRPGMAFTGIIGRRLDREVINLGFSGNARLDLEIAEVMAGVADPSVYVIDCMPNSSVEELKERGEKFFRILRDAHPDVPVIFIDDPYFAKYEFDPATKAVIDAKNEALAEFFKALKKSGEKNIYYISKHHMIGTDNEPFVDGVHYTDLGMMRYADYIVPILKKRMR